MEVLMLKAKKWGNSLGLIIPKEIVQHEQIKEHKTVRVLILPDSRKALKESFGLIKGKINAQKLKDQIREELYD